MVIMGSLGIDFLGIVVLVCRRANTGASTKIPHHRLCSQCIKFALAFYDCRMAVAFGDVIERYWGRICTLYIWKQFHSEQMGRLAQKQRIRYHSGHRDKQTVNLNETRKQQIREIRRAGLSGRRDMAFVCLHSCTSIRRAHDRRHQRARDVLCIESIHSHS